MSHVAAKSSYQELWQFSYIKVRQMLISQNFEKMKSQASKLLVLEPKQISDQELENLKISFLKWDTSNFRGT